MENTNKPRKEKSNVFEPIIIRFNNHDYIHDISKFNTNVELFNEFIDELSEIYNIKLTDQEIIKYILKKEPFNEFLSKIKESIERTQILRIQYEYNNYLNDYSPDDYNVKDGKISLKNDFVEKLRRKHTVSLDTPRAKKIYDLHQKAHALIIEIREIAREKGVSVEIGTLFEYDREYNIRARELRYNEL